LERSDSNDKILLSVSNVSLDLSQDVINLRGIPDNLPAFGTWQIYSLSPRPENSNRRIRGGFLFVFQYFREFESYYFQKSKKFNFSNFL